MKYKNILFLVVLVVLSLLYTWYEANRPQPVDWSETYSPEDKIPYGTYITFRSLKYLFPASEIVLSDSPVTEQVEKFGDRREMSYLFIDRLFDPGVVELERLLEWVDRGNHLFVAAENIADTVLNIFDLKLRHEYGDTVFRVILKGEKEMVYRFPWRVAWLEPGEHFQGRILGYRIEESDRPFFVEIPYGEGKIWLNTFPKGFTNYAVHDSLCGDFYYRALSWLPAQQEVVVWDARQTIGLQQNGSPFRVILQYPALRLALYLILAGVLLYGVFRIRREQRPIPVVLPPENGMLEFVDNVSALYWKKKEHTAIALKQIDFFLGEIRNKYLIRTDTLDETFITLLSGRSGVDVQKTRQLVGLIRKIRENGQVDEEILKRLINGTDEFIN